ncbi:hypothetical protein CARUB_v10012934mg [Capsella rubella]|uniref:Leucine-rich repeat-containing N-terminal plant-type domain-containing protein n=1 Tax=Capsella rubella TaxID=81985 RepID=R0HWL9_9BRAS|nr:receptor-like protein 12 [Capsella rubella]EOA29840.1 hypothetical protein CARUB_v10012934mg [Capsella rubella]
MKGSWNSTSMILVTLYFLLSFVHNFGDVLAAPTRHLCRPEQRDALLQFKNEFQSQNPSCDYNCLINGSIVHPHPKTESWGNNNDCCNWEGVTCNAKSGEVIELDLSCSCLLGRFHSNSSLQNLPFLTTLDLSSNGFSGQILALAGNLSHLTTLDLSFNRFSDLILSSTGNISQLMSLDLSYNLFSGQVPSWIGNLYKLTSLELSSNNFVGEIPSSFGNLNQLTTLGVSRTYLSGNLPISLPNLTRLTDLTLNFNLLTGTLPPNISSLSNLKYFQAAENAFTGTLPSSLFTIPSLIYIILSDNQFNGNLEFGNISLPSNLKTLDVNNNNFIGPIPRSISKLVNLKRLSLSHLNTQSPVDFSLFSHLKSLEDLNLSHLNTPTTIDLNDVLSYFKSLRFLYLSGNHVSVTNKSSVSYPPSLYQLRLSGCGITELPEFLRTQHEMAVLDISNNKIKGQVPRWLWTQTNLDSVNLSNNTITGFERASVPKPSMMNFFGSNNNLTGNIPSFVCTLRSLRILDLSDNNFSGSIPRCMGNLKKTLSVLNLRRNNLSGGLPEHIFERLRTLDVGHNQLVGMLPRSLRFFSILEVLNVESNIINDTFSFWLSSLPELQVLVLRSNAFHGPIHQVSFSKLRIIDISHNQFNGTLPTEYFLKWSGMSSHGTNSYWSDQKYIGDDMGYYHDSLVLINRGSALELERIFKLYTTIDFSGNKFEGEIPTSIGLLKDIRVLNLANNAFTGRIPSSMGNLTVLESLDVSQNKLSGEIPQELGNLSFLAYMNFAHNQLSGLIPGGNQFRRQNCSAFEDNLVLFGPSLDEVCRNKHTPASQQNETPESEEEEEEFLSWIAAGIGFIPGIAFGLAMGYKPKWLMNFKVQRAQTSGGALKLGSLTKPVKSLLAEKIVEAEAPPLTREA